MSTLRLRRPAPRTLPDALRHALVWPVCVVLALAGGYAASVAAQHAGILPAVAIGIAPPDADPGDVAVTPEQRHAVRVADMLNEYRCWSGTAPAAWQGRFPRGVVVTVGHSTYPDHWTSQAKVSRALDAALSGGRPGLQVHGFCAR